MSDDQERQAQKALKRLRHFGLGLGILGALFGVFGVYFLYVANEALAWSSVQGTVVKAEVNTDYSFQKAAAGGMQRATVYYDVAVNYTYEVDGQSYFSSRSSFGQGHAASQRFRERADAEAEAASRFPAGTAVTVHYDPNNPAEAVLKPGWNWGTLAPLLIGLFLGGSGWLFYAVGKSAKEPSESKA